MVAHTCCPSHKNAKTAGSVCIWDQQRLLSELEASLGYNVRLCTEQTTNALKYTLAGPISQHPQGLLLENWCFHLSRWFPWSFSQGLESSGCLLAFILWCWECLEGLMDPISLGCTALELFLGFNHPHSTAPYAHPHSFPDHPRG